MFILGFIFGIFTGVFLFFIMLCILQVARDEERK